MIISASRRTDIPAFFSTWFLNRIHAGYVLVRNPMNANQVSKISLDADVVDCIVFWTKNPKDILPKLKLLNNYQYYFQFTLTPYNNQIEPCLPDKSEIIDTFKRLSDQIGPEKVIWRYDPIFLSESVNKNYHYESFARLATQLQSYTYKCMISFIDLYRNVKNRMKEHIVAPIDTDGMIDIAKRFVDIAQGCNIKLETCAERIDLSSVGIEHGKCIDDRLISKLRGSDLNIEKDKRQRDACGCVSSIDIGEYNTCAHGCLYCYANFSSKVIAKNRANHEISSPLIVGNLSGKEKINERKMTSNMSQTNLFSLPK